MSGKYLLDTNIVIGILANDQLLIERIKNMEEVYIPITVVGELYFGAFKSKKVKKT